MARTAQRLPLPEVARMKSGERYGVYARICAGCAMITRRRRYYAAARRCQRLMRSRAAAA